MALRTLRILYQAKNNATGLLDVKGQIYFNDAAKAVGASALTFSELDSTNAPGAYFLDITPAQLTTWGATPAGPNTLYAVINSASKSAEAVFKADITINNTDDIEATLGTPAGASVSADLASVKSDTAAIKSDLETGPNNLGNIYSALQAIQNNQGFSLGVPATLIKPGSGSNSYRIPIYVYNEKNQLVDPDSNSITITLLNQAGADRGSYMTGYVAGSPGTAPAVRDSLGKYHIDIAIPSTASQEQLNFSFAYSVGGSSTARAAATEIISDVNADGFALQSTLLATQTTVNSIQSEVLDSTNGLPAIKTAVNGVLSEIQTNVEGTGFVVGTDSLHAISAYLIANLFTGGKAV